MLALFSFGCGQSESEQALEWRAFWQSETCTGERAHRPEVRGFEWRGCGADAVCAFPTPAELFDVQITRFAFGTPGLVVFNGVRHVFVMDLEGSVLDAYRFVGQCGANASELRFGQLRLMVSSSDGQSLSWTHISAEPENAADPVARPASVHAAGVYGSALGDERWLLTTDGPLISIRAADGQDRLILDASGSGDPVVAEGAFVYTTPGRKAIAATDGTSLGTPVIQAGAGRGLRGVRFADERLVWIDGESSSESARVWTSTWNFGESPGPHELMSEYEEDPLEVRIAGDRVLVLERDSSLAVFPLEPLPVAERLPLPKQAHNLLEVQSGFAYFDTSLGGDSAQLLVRVELP